MFAKKKIYISNGRNHLNNRRLGEMYRSWHDPRGKVKWYWWSYWLGLLDKRRHFSRRRLSLWNTLYIHIYLLDGVTFSKIRRRRPTERRRQNVTQYYNAAHNNYKHESKYGRLLIGFSTDIMSYGVLGW